MTGLLPRHTSLRRTVILSDQCALASLDTHEPRGLRKGETGSGGRVRDALRRGGSYAGIGGARSAAKGRGNDGGVGEAAMPRRCRETPADAVQSGPPRRDPRGVVPRERAGRPAGGVGRPKQRAARGHVGVGDGEGALEVQGI